MYISKKYTLITYLFIYNALIFKFLSRHVKNGFFKCLPYILIIFCLLYDLYNTVLDLTTWLSNNYNIVNFDYIFQNWENYTYVVESVNNCVYIIENIDEGITSSLILSIKSLSMVFIFIWVRASFPRIRFDQLMTYCWTIMLPILFGFILFVPCFMYTFNMLPTNVLYG